MIATPYGDPIQDAPGREGCGESVQVERGHIYHYRVGKRIPRNKPAVVMWEGNYCGRQNGERDYLIIAWDGQAFRVLESPGPGSVRQAMSKYAGHTNLEAIAAADAITRQRQAELDAMPKCRCGNNTIQFEDDQRDDECLSCYQKRNRKAVAKSDTKV